ncbi:MAG TPA: winged helix DNA-binding domain-containing protein [Baekduia sp.]|nr:winged helix DNA-binding domain-containing protein [Baekduia sp.]
MPAARVLTQRQLHRALLARQGLLERRDLALPRALERFGAIQAQYAPSTYVGLWSRLAGFERETLSRLLERRTVVQGTLMRSTIHLVSRRDWWPLSLAVREERRKLWLRAHGVGEPAMREAAEAVRARLAAAGIVARRDLDALVGRERAAGVGLWVDLVRAPPSGTWERRRADLFALAEDWVGPPAATAAEGVELLVRRYLSAFGPAARGDVASFTGLRAGELAPAIERVATRRFADSAGGELLDVARAPLPDPATPAPVRFLPTFDATLLVHARRTGLLPEEHRPRIFSTRKPHSEPTFLVDGVVAGTWRLDGGRVTLSPFGRLDGADRRALEEEGERLAAFAA